MNDIEPVAMVTPDLSTATAPAAADEPADAADHNNATDAAA